MKGALAAPPVTARRPRSPPYPRRKTEMMADLVDQHVGDDGAQRLLFFAPEVEQRTPIEPDHVGHRAGFLDRGPMRQAAAAKQPEQVEFALRAHFIERLVVGEIDHLDHQPLAEPAKRGGQLRESRMREGVDVGGARRRAPRERRNGAGESVMANSSFPVGRCARAMAKADRKDESDTSFWSRPCQTPSASNP